MDSQSLDSEVADPLFDTALAEYQRQVDEQGNGFRGEIRRQILARFPDYESEFAEFFAVEDEFPGSRGPHPGGSIGPYRLLQKVGEGAMGTVWCARQLSPIRRLVALKLVKSAINSGEVLKRFQIEQDALALMDHSSIAKIFDAGIGPDGQPYFAMELIRGVSIVAYCDSNDLSVNDRLNLILQVCAAVQHAHQKGVIHRDLKPTNIMVTISDGKPAVKVIDFGLAKALHHHLNDDSIQTQFGQVLGSFDYMPPEQAELSALGVDTRSDVYALGAVLYELLTGSKPLQLEKKTVAEKLRLIRDEDAPSPSVSLSASAEKLEQLAAQRRTTPALLVSALKNDLDWLVLKALEKDPLRRYESVESFRADIERFLNDEPLVARPPSPLYRLRKFYRRRRLLALVSCALVAGFMIASVGVWIALIGWNSAVTQAGIAKTEASNAERARAEAKQAENAAVLAQSTLQQQLTLADAWRIMDHSARLRTESPVVSALLAAAAVQPLRRYRQRVPVELEHQLRLALAHLNVGTRMPIGSGETFILSADGRRLLTEEKSQRYVVYDITEMPQVREIASIPRRSIGTASVNLSRDGSLIAIGQDNGKLSVWRINDNVQSPAELSLVGHGNLELIDSVSFSPSGRWLASTGYISKPDGYISSAMLWDLRDPNRPALHSSFEEPPPGYLSFSEDDKCLMCSNQPQPFYKLPDGAAPYTERQSVTRLRAKLASAADEEVVVMNRANTCALTKTLNSKYRLYKWSGTDVSSYEIAWAGESMEVQQIDPSATWLLLKDDYTQKLRLHRIAASDDPRPKSYELGVYGRSIHTVMFSPDGHWVAGFGKDKDIILWQIHEDREPQMRILHGHDAAISLLHFHEDSRRLLSRDSDKLIRVWDLDVRDRIKEPVQIPLDGPYVSKVKLSPNGRWLVAELHPATEFEPKKLFLWDLAEYPARRIHLEVEDTRRSGSYLTFSLDSQLLIAVFGIENGEPIAPRSAVMQVWKLDREIPRVVRKLTVNNIYPSQPWCSSDSRFVVVQDGVENLRWFEDLLTGTTRVEPVGRGLEDCIVGISSSLAFFMYRSQEFVLNQDPVDIFGRDVVVKEPWRVLAVNLLDRIEKKSDVSSKVNLVEFTPDGMAGVQVESDSRTIRAIKVRKSGIELGEAVEVEGWGVKDVLLSPNGKWLMYSSAPWHYGSSFKDQFSPPDSQVTSSLLDLDSKLPTFYDLQKASTKPNTNVSRNRFLAFSADSTRVFISEDKSGLKMWDLSGEKPNEIPFEFASEYGPALEGELIASDRWLCVSSTKTISLWRLQIDDLLETINRVAGRSLTPLERKKFRIAP